MAYQLIWTTTKVTVKSTDQKTYFVASGSFAMGVTGKYLQITGPRQGIRLDITEIDNLNGVAIALNNRTAAVMIASLTTTFS